MPSPSASTPSSSAGPVVAEARGIHFIVGGQLYAVPFHWVRELVDDPDLLPTPEEGDLKGLARVRDHWVPVIPLGVTSAQAALRGGTVMVVIGGERARLSSSSRDRGTA